MPTIFIIQLLAFWPVWTWYIATLRDPATDTSVVIALFTAIFFCVIKKPIRRDAKISFRMPMILLLIYIMTFPWLPPFGRAVVAMLAVSYTLNRWRFGTQSQPWLYGLLLMALPVLSPMYVYLAYPLRLIVGKLAALFLQPFGFPVFFEGIAFNWNGQMIWSDELCSGVRKLWAGGGFTFALAALYDLRFKRTLFLAGWAVMAFIAANVLRTMFLVYMYGALPQLPWWAHTWEGPLMFLIAALAIAGVAQTLQKAEFVRSKVTPCKESVMALDEILQDIHALEADLQSYERKYGILSKTFYESYLRGEEPPDETSIRDWTRWASLYKIWLRRREQYDSV